MQSEQNSVYRRHNLLINFLNLVFASVIWTVCSLMVVSFGPASIAVYHTIVRSMIHGEGHFVKTYFLSFRNYFKRSVLVGIVYLLLAVLLVFWIRFANALADTAYVWQVLRYVYLCMLLVLGVIGCFLFAAFTHTNEKAVKCVKTGLILAFRHLFTSITCFLVLFITGWLILMFPACILILPGVCFLIFARVMEPYFSRAFGET